MHDEGKRPPLGPTPRGEERKRGTNEEKKRCWQWASWVFFKAVTLKLMGYAK